MLLLLLLLLFLLLLMLINSVSPTAMPVKMQRELKVYCTVRNTPRSIVLHL